MQDQGRVGGCVCPLRLLFEVSIDVAPCAWRVMKAERIRADEPEMKGDLQRWDRRKTNMLGGG